MVGLEPQGRHEARTDQYPTVDGLIGGFDVTEHWYDDGIDNLHD